nr:LysM peptidoglycan-binding domain-containing protein [uncultured Blautia sp.]
MIEIVYEKEKQKPEGNEGFFRIPNNIRQIGEVGGTQKIYIEDYAYTYLCRISSENSGKGIAAILLGQANWRDGISYLFVKSAVILADMEVNEEHLVFTQEIWNHVYEKNKEYFQEQEVVGWFLSIPGCSMEINQIICQTHLNHFGGNDKVLFVMEPLEKEEAFYRYEDGNMTRQTGFYVYYEKNESMRNYLVSQNEKSEKKSEEVNDEAVHTFRKKIEKKTEQEKKKAGFPLFKTASVCAAAAVLAVGVLYLNDYKKLKGTQEVLAGLEDTREEKDKEAVTPVNAPSSEKNQKEEEQSTEKETGIEDLQQQEVQTQNEPEKEEAADTPVHQSYTIQPGDTMTRISVKNYGTIKKIKEICELNNMSETDTIYPGQIILLP